MIDIPQSRIEIVHLAIDIQTGFLAQLSAKRQKAFPAAIRSFADAIKPIPTLWVIMGDEFKVYASNLTDSIKHKNYGISGRLDVPVLADEDILIKTRMSAFGEDVLIGYLKAKYPALKSVIVSGMNTRYCVAGTMTGAIANHLHCFGMYDLMADGCSGIRDSRPHAHRTALLHELLKPQQIRRFDLIDQKQFAQEFNLDPAYPLGLKPGSNLGRVRAGL